jgi:hypothetical protein
MACAAADKDEESHYFNLLVDLVPTTLSQLIINPGAVHRK